MYEYSDGPLTWTSPEVVILAGIIITFVLVRAWRWYTDPHRPVRRR